MIQHWVRAKMMRCRLLHMRRSAIVIQVRVIIVRHCLGGFYVI